MDNTEEQPMPSLNPGSQSSYPILKQFEEYCNEPHQPVEQTISVKHLKQRGNYLHQYWQSKKRQRSELSTFALGQLAFSGAGVGVERLFSGASIQVEGRMRSLSNVALKVQVYFGISPFLSIYTKFYFGAGFEATQLS